MVAFKKFGPLIFGAAATGVGIVLVVLVIVFGAGRWEGWRWSIVRSFMLGARWPYLQLVFSPFLGLNAVGRMLAMWTRKVPKWPGRGEDNGPGASAQWLEPGQAGLCDVEPPAGKCTPSRLALGASPRAGRGGSSRDDGFLGGC